MRIQSVNISDVRTVRIRGRAVETGIYKQPAEGRVAVRRTGLVEDRQADLEVHGGEHMAVYLYPGEHYAAWRRELGREETPPGLFGENLTTWGLLEETARVGEVYRMGTTHLQVTQPRVPCFKLEHRMDAGPGFARRFLRSGRVGFYLRVIQEGELGAGDTIERVEEAPDSVTIEEFVRFVYLEDRGNAAGIRRILASRDLSRGPKGWRERLEAMLARIEAGAVG